MQHLGMVLCMMTLLLYNERRQIVEYSGVHRCIEHISRGSTPQVDAATCVWVCLVALIWTQDSTAGDALRSKLWHSARDIGTSCSATRPILTCFPWIDAIHDDAAREIFDRLFE